MSANLTVGFFEQNAFWLPGIFPAGSGRFRAFRQGEGFAPGNLACKAGKGDLIRGKEGKEGSEHAHGLSASRRGPGTFPFRRFTA